MTVWHGESEVEYSWVRTSYRATFHSSRSTIIETCKATRTRSQSGDHRGDERSECFSEASSGTIRFANYVRGSEESRIAVFWESHVTRQGHA